MIISIYGLPRSGKDTFISKIVSNSKNAIHIKGSETLNQLSFVKYGCSFHDLSCDKMNQVRKDFTFEVKKLSSKYELIIVDGHFSFPNKFGNFEIVFTEDDLLLYDAFFYLNTSFAELYRNFYSSNKKNYSEYLLNEELAQNWKNFEITSMKKIVEKNDKDFILIDTSIEALDFVLNYKKTSLDISKEIVNFLNFKYKSDKYILTDLDKTISINDLTNDYIDYSNLDSNFPKTIFKGDFYTPYQFYKFHSFLSNIVNINETIKYAISKIELNQLIIEEINSFKETVPVVALTTGILDAWNIINKDINLFNDIYGTIISDEIIITPLVKKLVAKLLVKNGKKVLAIGDSIIDLSMLKESTTGYIISMQKLDKRIINNLLENGFTNLYQLPYSKYKYENIKEGNLKW